MLIVFISIVIVVCIYSVITHRRNKRSTIFKMSREFDSGMASGLRESVIEDSDIMTEQSSSSDLTANHVEIEDDSEESRQQISAIDSQTETLEYSEIHIEDPPSFFNSQFGSAPSLTMKNYFKALPSLGNNHGDDSDDDFEKRPQRKERRNKSSAPDDNQPGSSSGSGALNKNNQKPRKPRKPRDRTQSKRKRWLDKSQPEQEEDDDVGKEKGKPGFFDIFQQNSYADEDLLTSDSSASVSVTIPEEVTKPRKVLKHITIVLDEETEVREEKEPPPPEVKHEVLQIAGVDVKFPVKPYPSQIAVMNKLIQGCKKQEHCLLESPTGSGKTLALLCGVLAWQEHMKDELRQQNAGAMEKAQEQIKAELQSRAGVGPQVKEEKTDESSASCCSEKECKNPDDVISISEDDDQQPVSKKFCPSTSPGFEQQCETEKRNFAESPQEEMDLFGLSKKIIPTKKLPTVYYGSRTHKQIEQVVRELKKTAYAYKHMTILSSREFTCLQQTDRNKTEVCAKLLDPAKHLGCRYYNENTKKRISTNRALNQLGINGPWDIEDLVLIGKDIGSCPYFAARDLMLEAEIIFCPYNYLVDPSIRESMQIELEGQIVILDEAHNIEEMSREVGSLAFREDKITEVIEDVELVDKARKHERVQTYIEIGNYLKKFLEFIKNNKLNNVDKFSETCSSQFWTGVQLCELFNIHNLGKGFAKTFQTAAAAAIMDFNTAKEEASKPYRTDTPVLVITPLTKRFLEDLTMGLEMMTSEKLADDYRACIIESDVKDFSQTPDNTWVPRGPTIRRLRTLQMLCMNPAVIFAPLANVARCVVLASGTLSPISSFQSELGTSFPHKLDANHVVPKENVYIRGIPCGPTGVQLKANYTNVNSWNFQDELGRLVLNVCRVVPHGVLCFFSSYSMMQKQIDRWKRNSCWEQLEEVKHVLREPRGSSNLEPVMKEFREVIQSTSEVTPGGITGALLLAVFRGKVAEGIDFSDNEARCVMAVGIPYAVRKDPSVDMKYTYNDLNQSKGLLRGGEWYAVQAFRALNQALGRCLRHRNDWGAVLLVDQRFLERTSYNYLPKWVKTMWRDSVRFNLTHELEQFVAAQIERTNREKSNLANSPIKSC